MYFLLKSVRMIQFKNTKIYTSNSNVPTYYENWHYVVEWGLGAGDSGIPPPPPSDPDPLLSAPSMLSTCMYSFSDNRTIFFSSFLAPGLLILSFFFFFSAWRTLPQNWQRDHSRGHIHVHTCLVSHKRARVLIVHEGIHSTQNNNIHTWQCHKCSTKPATIFMMDDSTDDII